MRVGAIIVGAIIVVAFAQVVYAVVVFFVFSGPEAMSTRGQFGDLFGAVTAFFTGLAFAGVIYTVYLQTEELESARRAQADQVAALKESAAGVTEQVKNMQHDRRTMIEMDKRRKSMEFISRFNEPSMVELRGKAVPALRQENWKNEPHRHSVLAYLNFFEEMALAISNDVADEHICRCFFQRPAVTLVNGADELFKQNAGSYRYLRARGRKWEREPDPVNSLDT
jgi:hypothetical protein